MKNFLLILFALFSYAVNGIAQVQFGIKGGLNLSDVVINNYINPDAESDFDTKAGIHGGVFASTDLNEKFGLSAELLYSNKGVKAHSRINLHYINLPLLLQYNITDEFRVEVGSELGYLFAAKSKFGDERNIWNNKLDIGLDVGVQYLIWQNIKAGLRYNAGFSSIIDTMNSNQTSGETIKYLNRVLQLSVSYQLGEKMF